MTRRKGDDAPALGGGHARRALRGAHRALPCYWIAVSSVKPTASSSAPTRTSAAPVHRATILRCCFRPQTHGLLGEQHGCVSVHRGRWSLCSRFLGAYSLSRFRYPGRELFAG